MFYNESGSVYRNLVSNSAVVKTAYKKAVKKNHPDCGGNVSEFNRVQNAYEKIMKGKKL
jgi:curved DNA-binding protein CbpA